MTPEALLVLFGGPGNPRAPLGVVVRAVGRPTVFVPCATPSKPGAAPFDTAERVALARQCLEELRADPLVPKPSLMTTHRLQGVEHSYTVADKTLRVCSEAEREVHMARLMEALRAPVSAPGIARLALSLLDMEQAQGLTTAQFREGVYKGTIHETMGQWGWHMMANSYDRMCEQAAEEVTRGG